MPKLTRLESEFLANSYSAQSRRRRLISLLSLLFFTGIGSVWVMGERKQVFQALEYDTPGSKRGADLARRVFLEELAVRARRAMDFETSQSVAARLVSLAPAPASIKLEDGTEVREMVIDSEGERLALRYDDRVKVLELQTSKLITRRSADFCRDCVGRFTWLAWSDVHNSFVLELEHQGYADHEDDGEPVDGYLDGNEREIVTMRSMRRLGITQHLAVESVKGVEADGEVFIDVRVPRSGPMARNESLISADPSSLKSKWRHSEFGDTRAYLLGWRGNRPLFEVDQEMSRFTVRETQSVLTTFVIPGEAEIRFDGKMRQQVKPYENPVFTLAAVCPKPGIFLVEATLYGPGQRSRVLQYDPTTLKGVSFTADGDALILSFEDGSTGLFSISRNRLLHRCYAGQDGISVASPIGDSLFVLTGGYFAEVDHSLRAKSIIRTGRSRSLSGTATGRLFPAQRISFHLDFDGGSHQSV